MKFAHYVLLGLIALPLTSLAEVTWNKPSVDGMRHDPLLKLRLSGLAVPGSEIATASSSIQMAEPDGQNFRSISIGAAPLKTKANSSGSFELVLKVPAGTFAIPIEVETPDGKTENYQFIYQVSFDKVVENLPEPPDSPYRGVDIRVLMQSSQLQMVSLAARKTSFSGFGTTVSAHLYIIERDYFRLNGFLSSRITSYKSSDLPSGEKEGLQYQSLGPGLEVSYGWFYLQGFYHWIVMDDYYVSSQALSKTLNFSGARIEAGLNYRFKRLGLGIGVSQAQIPVDKGVVSSEYSSRFNDLSVSLNLVYFLGSPPLQFIRDLF
ncbi:MAG: hypothetical protein AB7F86_08645 [Bdellovibrionales bacterium]